MAIHADLPPPSQAGSDHRRHRLRHRRGEEPAWRHPAPDLPEGLDGRVYAVAQGSLVVGGLGAEGRTAPRWW